MIKSLHVNAGNAGDLDLIPGSGRSPGEESGTHSSIFAWEIPWTEEPGRLQPKVLQKCPINNNSKVFSKLLDQCNNDIIHSNSTCYFVSLFDQSLSHGY